MKNSCDSCLWFTKLKSLQNDSGLCDYYDCRLTHHGSNGCRHYKSKKYKRVRNELDKIERYY